MFEYLVKIILTMSIAGSIVYLLLLLAELFLKRHIPPSVSYYLRLAALFFLLVPLWFLPLHPQSTDPSDTAKADATAVVTESSRDNFVQEAGGKQLITSFQTPLETEPGFHPDYFMVGLIWLAGMGVYFISGGIRLICYRRRISRLVCYPPPPSVQCCLQKALNSLGLSRHPKVQICAEVTVPMLTGIFSPVILLPQMPSSSERLTLILTHELLHYRRKDLWLKAAAYLASGVHWFNPLSWICRREINLLCELSCDECVVAKLEMDKKKEYGRAILQILSGSNPSENPLCASFGGGKRQVKRRLELIMKSKSKNKRIFALACCAAVLLTVAGFAAGCGMSPKSPVHNDSHVELNNSVSAPSSGESKQELAQKAGDALEKSLRLEQNENGAVLSFRMPDSFPEEGALFLSVTEESPMAEVRAEEETTAEAPHRLFEETIANSNWRPGDIYSANFAAASASELTIYFSVVDTETGEPLEEREILVTQSPAETLSERSLCSPLGSLPLDISAEYNMGDSGEKPTHNGMDFRADEGLPIYAVLDGTVSFAGWDNVYGQLIRLTHGNGLETWYAHCSKLNVSEGDTVTQGQKIAEVGNTGRATGDHLHLSLYQDGEFLDPALYLNGTLPE